MEQHDAIGGAEAPEPTIAATPVAVAATDAGHRIVFVNGAFERLTGYTIGELRGLDCRILQEETDPATIRTIETALAERRPFRGEVLHARKNGERFWAALQVDPVVDGTGETTGFVVVLEDVTGPIRRRRLLHALDTAGSLLATVSQLAAAKDRTQVTDALAEAVVQAGADGATVAMQEPDGRLHVVSTRGWASEVIAAIPRVPGGGEPLPELVDWRAAPSHWVSASDAAPLTRRFMDLVGVDRFTVVPVVAAHGAHGAVMAYWVDDPDRVVDPTRFDDRLGRLAEVAAVVLDNLELIEQVRAAAARDQLTGTATRAVVEARLEQAIGQSDGTAAVLYMDADRFKRINDSLGHAAGDRLLALIAERLTGLVGSSGTVGRPGGDEFVAVLPEARDAQHAEALAAEVERVMRTPFDIDGRTVYASLSIGCDFGGRALLETPRDTAERLLRGADAAMYTAKERKRARRRVDTPLDVVLLESDLHRALALGEITTHFQPQFDGRTGRLAGFEAFARWTHGTFGPIPPDVFIPIAEDTDVILEVGAAVLREAFSFADAAQSRFGPLQIGVNVSRYQLTQREFLPQLVTVLGEHPERRWALTVEIPEQDLVEEDAALQSALSALRTLDIDIAVDDFGSGSSSLKTLQTLPITSIKIDEAFLRHTGALGSGMIAAIANLGSGLGLEVMAEGLESSAQLMALRRLGCGRMQGFILGSPLPGAQALEFPATLDEALRSDHP